MLSVAFENENVAALLSVYELPSHDPMNFEFSHTEYPNAVPPIMSRKTPVGGAEDVGNVAR